MDRDSTRQLIQNLKDFADRNASAEVFSEEDFAATFGQITPFVRTFPIHFETFECLRSRAMPYATDLENVKQMGPPPEHRVRGLSRCNHEGQSILYGASNLPTSFLELGLSESHSCAITTQFRLRDGEALTLIAIGELDHYRRHKRPRLGTPGIAEQIDALINPLEAYDQIAHYFVDSYLADLFSRPADSQRNVYEVTARIANAFLQIEEIDGIIYPSVRHEGGLNYALRSEVFGKLDVVKFSLTCTASDCLDTLLHLRPPFAWHKPDGLQGVT